MKYSPATLVELLVTAVKSRPRADALRFKRAGQWEPISSQEFFQRVRSVACGLHNLGVKRGDHVGLLSENRPEWSVADFAILANGAADVPVYPTSTAEQAAFILADAGVEIIFVSTQEQVERILSVKDKIGSLKRIISFESVSGDAMVSALADLEARGRALDAEHSELFERFSDAVESEDLATLIYTSGTTGEPKGVMLTHTNLVSNVIDCRSSMYYQPSDVALSYLPLSHIFERMIFYAFFYYGVTICYSEGFDRVGANLLEVRPTVMTSVPRLFEKVFAKIEQGSVEQGFPRKQIFFWAKEVGMSWAKLKANDLPVPPFLDLKYQLAYKLVFKDWRGYIGDRIANFIAGGAPLPPDLAYIFYAGNILILQGYGLTETSPVISASHPDKFRMGSSGQPIPNVRVKIAPDGEICVKGPNVMKGYYQRPEATAAAFDDEGYFKTGDVGYLDPDGFLFVTDRKKDLIKTSGGKYIAPQPIENKIKLSRFVSQVVVVGNYRKHASALIVPNFEALEGYAQVKGITYSDKKELAHDLRIVDLLQRQVAKFTADLARWETIKKIAVLENELTIQDGELTPTLKVRRSTIERRYKDVIDRLYAEDGQREGFPVNRDDKES